MSRYGIGSGALEGGATERKPLTPVATPYGRPVNTSG